MDYHPRPPVVTVSALDAVLAAYRQILDTPDVTADDDFFELGGDSIQAMNIIALLQEMLPDRRRAGHGHHAAGHAFMTPSESRPISTHAVLPGTKWTFWRQVVLRAPGFPAEGVDLLASPGLARAADSLNEQEADDGAGKRLSYQAAFEAETERLTSQVLRLAADRTFGLGRLLRPGRLGPSGSREHRHPAAHRQGTDSQLGSVLRNMGH